MSPAFKGPVLPNSKSIIGSAYFGQLTFQHFKSEGFEIWFSNYHIDYDTTIIGKADIPVLELHIQFLNQFNISWDGIGENTLKPYQYNISYTPFVNNKVKFLGDRSYHTFDIHFTLDYLNRFSPGSVALAKFINKAEKRKPASISDMDRFLSPEMIAIINSILQSNFNEILNRFFIECKVGELLTLILDQVAGKHPLLPLKLSEYDIDKLKEAREIILADFEEDISLSTLSRRVALNEYKLKKGFKYLFGTSVFEYRHKARMERAKLLILDTNLPIIDIAFMSGFNHLSNFQKAFKRHFNYTPAELKKYKQETR